LRNASLDQVRHVIDIVNTASSSSDLKELHDLRFVATGSPALTLSVADDVFNSLKFLVPLALLAVLLVALLALGAGTLPTLVVAPATAAGMLAFAVSGIPLVRQFGLFMAIGVAMAYLANYLVGMPALLFLARRFPALVSPSTLRTVAAHRLGAIGSLPAAAAI